MSIFNTPKPQTQPVPVTPNDDSQVAARLAAERAAIVDQKAAGRASTVHAGYEIAMDSQAARVKKRASTELGG